MCAGSAKNCSAASISRSGLGGAGVFVKKDSAGRLRQGHDTASSPIRDGVPHGEAWHRATPTGRLTRPRRHNGQPYRGINILLLWGGRCQGFSEPIWMNYRQAAELKSAVRRVSTGSLVVYADRFTKMGTGRARSEGRDRNSVSERPIRCSNIEQIDGCPSLFTEDARAAESAATDRSAEQFFAATAPPSAMRRSGVLLAVAESSDPAVPESFH